MQDAILPDNALSLAEHAYAPDEQPTFGVNTPPETVTEHRLQFVGSGSEYFKIWIVNLFLNILTLGIYSAWAKVRREQYFHRNTLLDGSGFDYHGDPKAILKGRVLAVGFFATLALIENLAPFQYYILALLLSAPLIPWLIVRSFVFRSRNTSFRGLHFDFRGTYKGLCKAFLVYVLALVAIASMFVAVNYSLEQVLINNQTTTEQSIAVEDDDTYVEDDEACAEGSEDGHVYSEEDAIFAAAMGFLILFGFLVMMLLIPAAVGTLKRFQLNHLAFGASGFQTRFRLSSFYGVYLRASLPFIAILSAASILGAVIALVAFVTTAGELKEFYEPAVEAQSQELSHESVVTAEEAKESLQKLFAEAMEQGALPEIVVEAEDQESNQEPVAAAEALEPPNDEIDTEGLLVGVIIIFVIFMAIYLPAVLVTQGYLSALTANLIWNNTGLEKHGFVSDQKFWGITGITLSNWLLILLTAGLYWPWAKVRLAAYRARHTAVLAADDLDNFIAGATREKSAIGEEIADIFDFDIAL
ncbi:MAG: YjgN family protein [Betaproteobacteria bacterium]|nr:YjgN family protein [Betaproteobacteria bacterium]